MASRSYLALALVLVACSSAEPAEIRNVVLISMDTTRADYIGSYGHPRTITPRLDELAAEGTRFALAISPAPLTLPAHSTLLTGTEPLRHGVRDNDGFRLDDEHITLAEVLSEQDFVTGAVVGAFVLDSRFGLAQGFAHYYDDFGAGHQDDEFAFVERKAQEGSQLAISFLEQNQSERFFLFAHFFDPHSYYLPPGPFAERFGPASYAGEIAYTDWAIGLILDKLKELDLYDETLIVVTSDHGESLGEHGELSHAYFIYQATQRVPLIVRRPGGQTVDQVNQVVGLVDVMPTILSLLGLSVPSAVQGRDLTPLLLGQEDRTGTPVYAESLAPGKVGANPLRALVGDRWKYIHGARPELYDLQSDPGEQTNLATEQPERARELAELLRTRVEASDQAEGRTSLTADERRRLEALGYVTGAATDPSLVVDPKRPDARDRISVFVSLQSIRALVGARRYDDARRLCEDLIDEHPETAAAYRFLGRVALAERRFKEAISHFRLYLALTPDPAGVLDADGVQPSGTAPLALGDRASAHSNLGVAHGELGDFAAAEEAFERALTIDPRNAGTRFNLGNALLGQQRRSEALTHYRRVLELDPGHSGARDLVARLERELEGSIAVQEAPPPT